MIEELTKEISEKSIVEQLKYLSDKFKGKIAFSTSFGQEDQVITDIIFKNDIDIEVFTLDTGRFFEETYKVWNKTIEKYNKKITVYFPDKEEVERLVSEKGPYSFYESIENRKECCNIRKVNPLKRALGNVDLWITGLRAEQSEARLELEYFSFEESFKLTKFNPLKDWTISEVVEYLKVNSVPYNILHDKGFISIGCSPCTRAIKEGEDIRAGRWWWEDKSKKECGLHDTSSNNIELENITNNIKKI
ncbi:MAG: phosphoadenylyl-sulfate reductase [Bacteroidales bacterium]|nr:phosphoadenylyl-sulfate reductase [Bacteroidales bacterium]MBN2755656.1 phosphoadenylyl-sulfate reductase [Bacteroidales bacterium]